MAGPCGRFRVAGFTSEKALTRTKNLDSMAAMKTKTIGLTFAVCFLAVAACFAANPQMGTWKLNEAKSRFTPGATKNTMVVYEAASDQVKVTVNGVNAKGKSTHNQWTGRFDGKNYPVTGDPNSDARSYKKDRRPHTGVDHLESRKSHGHWSNCGFCRWQKPHRRFSYDGNEPKRPRL